MCMYICMYMRHWIKTTTKIFCIAKAAIKWRSSLRKEKNIYIYLHICAYMCVCEMYTYMCICVHETEEQYQTFLKSLLVMFPLPWNFKLNKTESEIKMNKLNASRSDTRNAWSPESCFLPSWIKAQSAQWTNRRECPGCSPAIKYMSNLNYSWQIA